MPGRERADRCGSLKVVVRVSVRSPSVIGMQGGSATAQHPHERVGREAPACTSYLPWISRGEGLWRVQRVPARRVEARLVKVPSGIVTVTAGDAEEWPSQRVVGGSSGPGGRASARTLASSRIVATKDDLEHWVLDAVRTAGGSAHPIDVAKHVWQHHEVELRDSGDLFSRGSTTCVGPRRNSGTLARSNRSMANVPGPGTSAESDARLLGAGGSGSPARSHTKCSGRSPGHGD